VANDELTLALDMSDRTLALHLGLARLPDRMRLEYVPQATEHRHERMLDSLEWEMCEFSLATFIAARANGSPLRAIAIFPRRIFAVAMLFVGRESGITNPEQLIGRRVGIRSFHTTLCVWGLGDLASVYGVPLAEITWVTERADPFPVVRSQPWCVEQIGSGDSLDAALERGDIDAILVPRIPRAVRHGRAVPLFDNPGTAIRHYFEQSGVFPIMHTIVARPEVLERRPGLAAELMVAFEEAKRVGYSFYDDPNWSLLADSTSALEAQRRLMGDDPYPYGLEANVPTLNRLIRYERELGLITEELSAASLFVAA